MRIRQEILDGKIKGNNRITVRLCTELDKSPSTIYKWIKDNDESLTLAAALKIFREELKLTDADLMEPETVDA